MIILPVLLLLVMGALDLGRVFYGWVVLNNAARVGANYAALHADAWGTPADVADQTTYANLVTGARDDAGVSLDDCAAAPVPAPAFPTGTSLGDYAEVVLTLHLQPHHAHHRRCLRLGRRRIQRDGAVRVSHSYWRHRRRRGDAAAELPDGLQPGAVDPDDSLTVNFTDTTPATASGWIWDFGDVLGSFNQNPSHTYTDPGTYTVELQSNSNGTPCTPDQDTITVVEPPPSPDPSSSPDPSPSIEPTATPGCVVPSFIGDKQKSAQATWDAAFFTTPVQLDPDASTTQNWTVEFQSLVGGQGAPCNVTIVISPDIGGPTP